MVDDDHPLRLGTLQDEVSCLVAEPLPSVGSGLFRRSGAEVLRRFPLYRRVLNGSGTGLHGISAICGRWNDLSFRVQVKIRSVADQTAHPKSGLGAGRRLGDRTICLRPIRSVDGSGMRRQHADAVPRNAGRVISLSFAPAGSWSVDRSPVGGTQCRTQLKD